MNTNTEIKKWQEHCPYRNPAAATDAQKLDFACVEISELRAALEAAQQQRAGSVEPTYMTTDQARDWAWKQVRRDVGDSNWTVGDAGNYFGFFLHGWNYRGQYEIQRCATVQPDSERDAALEDAAEKIEEMVENIGDFKSDVKFFKNNNLMPLSIPQR